MIQCKYCNGSGRLWTACCNGANGCPCEGREIELGACRVCGGRGETEFEHNLEWHLNPNRQAILDHCYGAGFIGNPYGVSR
jgi:hypothetical protein